MGVESLIIWTILDKIKKGRGILVDKKNLLMSAKDQGVQWILNAVSNYGTQEVKDAFSKFLTDGLSEITADAATSSIPIIHGVVQGSKLRRYRENIMKYIDEVSNKVDEISCNLQYKWEDHEEEINKLHELVLDYVKDEQQVDKVEFLVNGFVNITAHDPESLTEDFVLTYYNLLESLSMVDITVLRDIYFLHTKVFQDIVDQFGIRGDQYKSVKHNLFRLGLLTTKAEQENTSDLEKLFGTVNGLIDYINDYNSKFEKALNGKNKKLPELKEKNIKMRSREHFRISNFGMEFVRFFLYTSEESEV